MGRCYEFGVSIDGGCEHAMSVVAEGGACECQVCAAHCPGRFAGCAQVVARPGYVPSLAPAWARSGEQAPPPQPALEAPRRSVPPPVRVAPERQPDRPVGALESELAVIRELVEKLLDAGAGETDLAALHAGLQARDDALTEVFDRLTAAHAELTAEVRKSSASQDRLAELTARLDGRLGQIEEQLATRSGVKDWLRRLG